MSQRHDALGAKEDSPHRLYLPLRDILRRDQILDLTGTVTGEPRGAPWGRVLSYSCACTWGSTEVPLGDAQSERHRSSCGRFQNPWASVRSALCHTVACARIPRHSSRTVGCCCCWAPSTRGVDSFCFIGGFHFGSLEVYCALGRWPNPTRKLVSSHELGLLGASEAPAAKKIKGNAARAGSFVYAGPFR